jgi:hypothetical protein
MRVIHGRLQFQGEVEGGIMLEQPFPSRKCQAQFHERYVKAALHDRLPLKARGRPCRAPFRFPGCCDASTHN